VALTAMDVGVIRGLITAALIVLFIALVFWAWSGKRRKTFEEAARMPLEEIRDIAYFSERRDVPHSSRADPESPEGRPEK
jgi:cytochrome c oxidase cbb3-type subunit 4